jgi:hypothetical protein
MRWVLRAVGTGYFIKPDGNFTKSLDEAFDLPSIKAAVELCRTRSLIGMELVLRFGTHVEATIPMGDVC